MTIRVLSTAPLVLTIDESEAQQLETIDAGAAYTKHLHRQAGQFKERPLSEFVEIVSSSINPRSPRYANHTFEYIDLREVDDLYGQILKFRVLRGSEIGSNKHRFQKWDILFAKIMPSLANKKIAIVSQDVTNAVASSEFLVLRKKPDVEMSLFYLFRALRSDSLHAPGCRECHGRHGPTEDQPSAPP